MTVMLDPKEIERAFWLAGAGLVVVGVFVGMVIAATWAYFSG